MVVSYQYSLPRVCTQRSCSTSSGNVLSSSSSGSWFGHCSRRHVTLDGSDSLTKCMVSRSCDRKVKRDGITSGISSLGFPTGGVSSWSSLGEYGNDRCRAKASSKPCTYDLVTLSNLCVDVLVPLDSLPEDVKRAVDSDRRTLLKYLSQNPPGDECWEVGGNTNTLIAAARLGMRAAAIGHVGNDSFGNFLERILEEERTGIASTILDTSSPSGHNMAMEETLVCFVLVDKATNEHTFCSRYDFGPWPLFEQVNNLSPHAVNILSDTSAVFVNGFVFDEIPEELVVQASKIAQSHGAAVLFDPGPRSWTFKKGIRRHALETMLDHADILLMTEEEAGAVVGTEDAHEAIALLMARPNTRATWFIVKQGKEGALLGDKRSGQVYHQEGYLVPVEDTVGCGDSFAAAIALGFTQGKDIPSTLALAGAVGAATAMGTGAGRNVANVERIRNILSQQEISCPTSAEKIQGALGMLGMDGEVCEAVSQ